MVRGGNHGDKYPSSGTLLGTRLSFPRFFQRFTIPSQICPSARAVTFYNGEHCRFAARSEFYRGNLRNGKRTPGMTRSTGTPAVPGYLSRLSDARAQIERAVRARARACTLLPETGLSLGLNLSRPLRARGPSTLPPSPPPLLLLDEERKGTVKTFRSGGAYLSRPISFI